MTTTTVDLYTMDDDHVITCAIAHIREKIVGVSWTTDSKTDNIYSPEDGTFSESAFTQNSEMALSSTQLTALKDVADTVTFTCTIIVGDNKKKVSATQTINLFTPSKIPL